MAHSLSGTIVERLITELFIPLIQNSLVAANFVVTKTEIKAASIKIWGVGAITTSAYTGGRLTSNQHEDTSVEFLLDKAISFSEDLDKLDTYQAAVELATPILQQAAYQIAAEIDEAVFTMLTTTTSLVAPLTVDASNVKAWIGSVGTRLTNLGAPKAGRKLALRPEIVAIMSEANLTGGSNEIATQAGKEFFITRFGGFDIFESVNLADGATTGKFAIASVPRCGALGLSYNEADIEDIPGQPVTNIWGVTSYGTKLVKEEYVVKADDFVA
jgi:hypothetical protein